MDCHPYDIYREEVKAALQCKLDEFALLDLEKVTEDDLWRMLVQKKWRKPKEEIHLYEIVRDIMSLKASDFMNFATLDRWQSTDLFSEEGQKELKELLKK